jgi:hypothetical protein
MSKAGTPYLRLALWQAASMAIPHNEELKVDYQRVTSHFHLPFLNLAQTIAYIRPLNHPEDDWMKTGIIPDKRVDALWYESTIENDLAIQEALNYLDQR